MTSFGVELARSSSSFSTTIRSRSMVMPFESVNADAAGFSRIDAISAAEVDAADPVRTLKDNALPATTARDYEFSEGVARLSEA